MNLYKTPDRSHLNVTNALLQISSLVLSNLTLPQIYKRIHEVASEVIPVRNIAIFLYEQETEIITFGYFVDEKDKDDIVGLQMALGEGLSSYVIKKNKPCLFTKEEQLKLERDKEITKVIGSISESWMGAPICGDDGVMGIIIIQSYNEEEIYDTSDLEVLSFVAANLAIVLQQQKYRHQQAIDKKALEESLEHIQQQKSTLENMMDELQLTQKELVQKEKMASLGNLVAGISHEINTPIGICVTGISNLHHVYKDLKKKMEQKTATNTHLTDFLEDVEEACHIIEANTQRAAQLINSFKEIAVDQSSESTREINLKDYIDEILLSMRPILKKLPYHVVIQCPEHLYLHTIPGAISQILTNLINNSILHGLDETEQGVIRIIVESSQESVLIRYEDNGKGLNEKEKEMLFEPFYTTKRSKGGSGLGTHLIYNLITSTLHGRVTVQSEQNKGLRYDITIPLHIAK
ncbi:GAF domain-containing sensor histidine kinase [Colwellia sp. RSH04]|uniref:GAF domain-containing sensor histidine kinase n=1 Tax=Colwellia sp. RSH04 TaxID=2305464 RepID=UPI000E57785C|nr:GAF domain-containing sensor histidine kinase [Colwellia sp. RSH04]RHW76357.1 GAF domain-containing protein [Colwellia sp. RSH04]